MKAQNILETIGQTPHVRMNRLFPGNEVWIKAERANLRKGPGTQHARITTLNQGEVLRTRQKTARWVKVETTDGLSGWVARSLLWGW